MKYTSIAKQLGSRGGRKTARKYSKEQRIAWGKLGGRPKKGAGDNSTNIPPTANVSPD